MYVCFPLSLRQVEICSMSVADTRTNKGYFSRKQVKVLRAAVVKDYQMPAREQSLAD